MTPLITTSPARNSLAFVIIVILIVYASDAWIWPVSSDESDVTYKPLSRWLHFAFIGCILYVVVFRAQQLVLALLRCWFIVSFVCYAGFSVTWTDDPAAAVLYLIWLGGSSILSAFVASSMPVERAMQVIWAISLIIVLSSLALFVAYPEVASMPKEGEGVRGLFDHKNIFGSFILAVSPVFLFRASVADTLIDRVLAMAAVGLLFVSLYLSRSGAGLVVTIAALAVWLVLPLAWRLRMGRPLAMLVAILVLGLAYWSFTLLTPQIADWLGKDSTLTGRTDVWDVILGYQPPTIFGSGLGSLRVDAAVMQNVQAVIGEPLRSAHSMYVQTLYETGYVGLLGYGAILCWSLSNAIRYRSDPRERSIGRMLGVVVSSIVLYGLVESRSGVRMSVSGCILIMLTVWLRQRQSEICRAAGGGRPLKADLRP